MKNKIQITISGLSGSGKTAVAQEVVETLRSKNF